MISTPQSAYQWLRDLGLSHDDSMKLIESRDKFEYFVAVLRG